MNLLKIKLNPYKDINTASLNDKPLSPYSELNNYMKEPFLNWASDLLDSAEREINDEYSLTVVSDSFEAMFLRDMQNDFDACIDYQTERFQLDTSVDERLELLQGLASKYNVSFLYDEYKLHIYSDVQLSLDSRYVESVPIEEADLIVTGDIESIKRQISNIKASIFLHISGKNSVSKIDTHKYLWGIQQDDVTEVVQSIIDRFARIPAICKLSSAIQDCANDISETDKKTLLLATEIDAFLSIEEIPEIEVGKTYTLKVSMIPATEQLPELRVISHNNDVVSVDGLTLSAQAIGRTTIDIYKSNENIPFEKREVVSFQDNSVKKIQLELENSRMGIGRKQEINVAFIPQDAEDINSLEWSVDRKDVISIDNGVITAVAAGSAIITASTKRASSKIEVSVLPNISSITSSVKQTQLYVGQTQPIEVSFEPNNCFDASYEWKSSDNSVAIVENQDDGKSVIRATGIGECTLTCTANEGGCSTSCNVTVESTFKKRENAHGMLSLTAVLAIACIFCAALMPVLCAPVAVATAVFGVLAIIRNKADRFWAFILVAIAVFVTLETLGITNII